jgi:ribose transport system ATP-binding protein
VTSPPRSALPALAARSVAKTFAGTRALSGVDLEVGAGQVHALLGENGSGKSTFIKVLSGYHRPDEGAEVLVAGEPLPFGSPGASLAAGCRFVHQDLGLVLDSTVLDNLSFGAGFPTRLLTIRKRESHARARDALALVGLDLDPSLRVRDLAAAERTGLAVARALLPDPASVPRLLVLDEPTATLPVEEVDRLLDLVQRVAASGVGVLYVSHRLDETFRIADAVTVLRDGHVQAARPVAGLTRPQLVELLVGGELERASAEAERLEEEHQRAGASRPALEVRDLHGAGLRGVSFSVEPGTIVGVAGLTGSGRETLLPTVFGALGRDQGSVVVDGRELRSTTPAGAKAAGLAYLPPDRKVSAGLLGLTTRENLTLARLRPFARAGTVRRPLEAREVAAWSRRLKVAPEHAAELPLAALSGGNQQKVLFAKWLRLEPKVFLLDEPTQGVDIGAKALLHHELVAAAASGTAVVISSTDADELAALCQRVLIVRDGAVVDELSGAQLSVPTITRESIGDGSKVTT